MRFHPAPLVLGAALLVGGVAARDASPESTLPVLLSDAGSDAATRAVMGRFDARGTIPCAQWKGQPTRPCAFGVARAGGGTATVVVTRPDGRKRILFFQKGGFQSADTSQADGYPAYGARKEADLYFVKVGEERYEIPEAVIYGG